MKTPHRVMYESLPIDVYRKWCNSNEIRTPIILMGSTASYILRSSFVWESSYDGKDYWESVARSIDLVNFNPKSNRNRGD